jgi:hypothetical protein
MILHRLTPWAVKQLTPETREAIEAAEPRDMLVTLGHTTGGWTCRILSPRQAGVLGEGYGGASIAQAFRWAVADMEAKQMLAEAGVVVRHG